MVQCHCRGPILQAVMEARNRVGIRLFRPARLHRLAESISWLLKSLKIPSLDFIRILRPFSSVQSQPNDCEQQVLSIKLKLGPLLVSTLLSLFFPIFTKGRRPVVREANAIAICERSELQYWIPVLRIRDVYPGSRIQDQKDSASRIRVHLQEFKYFWPKKLFLTSRKYDPGCSSRIRILIFTFPGSRGQKGTGLGIRNTAKYQLRAWSTEKYQKCIPVSLHLVILLPELQAYLWALLSAWNRLPNQCPWTKYISIKTPNPKCRLYWCLIEFTDWRYSQSCWYFRPL